VLASAAQAEVKQSAPDSLLIVETAQVKTTPAKAYAAISQVHLWWGDEYTWSGKAANLSLRAEAGGCFCEHWPGGSVEYGRVITVLPEQLVRIETALGVLQELAVKGVLSFSIAQDDDGATQLELDYRVNGAASSGLDQLAPKVDEMMAATFARLTRYIQTSSPEEKPEDAIPKAQAEAAAAAATRASILEQWRQQMLGQQPESGAAKTSRPASKKTTKPAAKKSEQQQPGSP
jgi:uncharacterized protein YndB with AHSA1/START domain